MAVAATIIWAGRQLSLAVLFVTTDAETMKCFLRTRYRRLGIIHWFRLCFLDPGNAEVRGFVAVIATTYLPTTSVHRVMTGDAVHAFQSAMTLMVERDRTKLLR